VLRRHRVRHLVVHLQGGHPRLDRHLRLPRRAQSHLRGGGVSHLRRPTPRAVGSDPPPPPLQRPPRWIRRTSSRRRRPRRRDAGRRPWRPLPPCREVRRLPARAVRRRAQGGRQNPRRSLVPALQEVRRQTLGSCRSPHHGKPLPLHRSRHPAQRHRWRGGTRLSLPRQPSA
jgi:hypothetical protein